MLQEHIGHGVSPQKDRTLSLYAGQSTHSRAHCLLRGSIKVLLVVSDSVPNDADGSLVTREANDSRPAVSFSICSLCLTDTSLWSTAQFCGFSSSIWSPAGDSLLRVFPRNWREGYRSNPHSTCRVSRRAGLNHVLLTVYLKMVSAETSLFEPRRGQLTMRLSLHCLIVVYR